jgi:hypothetical protein
MITLLGYSDAAILGCYFGHSPSVLTPNVRRPPRGFHGHAVSLHRLWASVCLPCAAGNQHRTLRAPEPPSLGTRTALPGHPPTAGLPSRHRLIIVFRLRRLTSNAAPTSNHRSSPFITVHYRSSSSSACQMLHVVVTNRFQPEGWMLAKMGLTKKGRAISYERSSRRERTGTPTDCGCMPRFMRPI